MNLVKLQSSELTISVIGTGCWSFGGGEYWGPQAQNDATNVVHASVANGINYFDTAEVYNEGRSEVSLGKAIKGIPRDKLIIGSKVSPANTYAGVLEKHCEESLRRLQTDYIDIYMVHWPIHSHSVRHFTSDENIIKNPPTAAEAFGSLQKLQKEGKIRHIGVSNFGYNRLKNDVPSNVQIVVNELPYNLLCRGIEYDTLPYCKEKGIASIGYITLLQGILTGKYGSLADVPEWQRRTRHFNCEGAPKCRHGEPGFEMETAKALKDIETISKNSGIKMSVLATQWVLKMGITCALVGARNVEQLEENIKAAEVNMDNEIIRQLNLVTENLKEKLGNHFDYYESAENDRTI